MSKAQKITAFVLFIILALAVITLYLYKRGWINYGRLSKPMVYFIATDNEQTRLVPVTREIPGGTAEEGLKGALEALIAGPTGEEKGNGIGTSVPEGAQLNNAWVSEGIAYVDFSPAIERGGGTTEMQQRLAQIIYTATQFPEVTAVRLLINNQPVKYFSSEGLTDVENPLTRNNFRDIIQEK